MTGRTGLTSLCDLLYHHDLRWGIRPITPAGLLPGHCNPGSRFWDHKHEWINTISTKYLL